MQKKVLDSAELTQVLKGICGYNSSSGEFLLPIIYFKKTPLDSLKKLFDGTGFLLKSLNIMKVGNRFHILVVKGKKQS